MANPYSADELIEFLDHAGDRGLIPAATAQALQVAARNVLGVLTEAEKKDLSKEDLASIVKRFNNKRARDFNPSSLKEYGRRVHRAVDLFLKWREDPSNFSVKTRAPKGAKRKERTQSVGEEPLDEVGPIRGMSRPGSYDSAVPVRPGIVVTLVNVPYDLSKSEAEKIATFVRMLAIES